MKGFRAEKSMYVAEVDDVEKRILGGIIADVALLLGTDLRSDDGEEDGFEPGRSLDDLLRGLTQDVAEPLDPALARLLPTAYEDDEERAAEFRRLTEGDIRSVKVERLRKWFDAMVGPSLLVYVPKEEAGDWAAALTDVRLVLGERLGIATAEDAEAVHNQGAPLGDSEEEQSRYALGQIYSALTWLQESLLAVMMRAR